MAAIELVDIGKLGSILKDTADAIAKLGDSIAHLVHLGAQGWDAASARRTEARFIEMRKQLVTFKRSQGAVAVSFEDYIARIEQGRQPRQLDWTTVTNRLLPLMSEARSLLVELKSDKSDFVLEDAYERLHDSLDARLTLFQRLKDADAPQTPEQIEALKRMVTEWERLREELGRASEALTQYLKGKRAE